ncbi:hypothetical protein, partial [Kitasatospora sp. NPDC007106]|uniref:hypothetical protein n=1 Tax=Kitasatospora sp. NPDC007106 TaxID=3156914 RepID=UPI0033CD2ED7
MRSLGSTSITSIPSDCAIALATTRRFADGLPPDPHERSASPGSAERGDWPRPEQDQQNLPTAIGIEQELESVAAKATAKAKPKASHADRFARGLAA